LPRPVLYQTKDSKGKYLTELSTEAADFVELLDDITELLGENHLQFQDSIIEIKSVATAIADGRASSFDENTFEYYKQALDKCLNSFHDVITSPEVSSNKQLKSKLNTFFQDVQNPDHISYQFEHAFKGFIYTVRDIRTGRIEKDIERLKQSPDFLGVKPNNIEAYNLSMYSEDIYKTFDQFLWIQSQHFLSSALYGSATDNSFYSKCLDNFTAEFETAPYDKQVEFYREFYVRRIALRDILYEKYDNAFKNAPEGEDPKIYARMKVMEAKEYPAYNALDMIQGVFMGVPMGAFTSIAGHLPYEPGEKFLHQRTENFGDEDLLDKIPSYLHEKDVLSNVKNITLDAAKMHMPELQKIGWNKPAEFEQIIDIYESMSNDTGSASESYEYMRQTLKEFVLYEGDLSSPRFEYLLDTAKKAAEEYEKTHSGIRFTGSGRQRQQWSKDLSKAFGDCKLNIEKANQIAKQTLKDEYKIEVKDPEVKKEEPNQPKVEEVKKEEPKEPKVEEVKKEEPKEPKVEEVKKEEPKEPKVEEAKKENEAPKQSLLSEGQEAKYQKRYNELLNSKTVNEKNTIYVHADRLAAHAMERLHDCLVNGGTSKNYKMNDIINDMRLITVNEILHQDKEDVRAIGHEIALNTKKVADPKNYMSNAKLGNPFDKLMNEFAHPTKQGSRASIIRSFLSDDVPKKIANDSVEVTICNVTRTKNETGIHYDRVEPVVQKDDQNVKKEQGGMQM